MISRLNKRAVTKKQWQGRAWFCMSAPGQRTDLEISPVRLWLNFSRAIKSDRFTRPPYLFAISIIFRVGTVTPLT